MDNSLPNITPDSFAKIAQDLKKQVRRLALQYDTVIYYRQEGILMEEKPGKYKRVVEEKC